MSDERATPEVGIQVNSSDSTPMGIFLARCIAKAKRRRADLVGMGIVISVGLLFLSPSLKDGGSFGTFDFDTTLTSLGAGLYSVIHSHANGDAVSQMIAWNALDWRSIHQGSFPLWNEYSGLGMPAFLNFESAVLSLPDLLSYAFPIRFAFLVVVATKLLLAGTGTYVFARVLRLRVPSATFAGVSYMLAGAFTGWLTWPLTDVACWTGWICAFGLLCYREPHKHRYFVGLALSVAFSIYGGFPEANVMCAMVLAAGVIVFVLGRLISRQGLSVGGACSVLGGGAIGVLCAAPLWFPGLQVIAVAHREADGHYVGLPMRAFAGLLTQGYFGLPLGTNETFQLTRWNYYETVSYVGIIALVLLAVAVFASKRRLLVIGLLVALFVSLIATYEPTMYHPFQNIVDHLGQLSTIRFERMRVYTAFFIAILAGIGFEEMTRVLEARRTRRSFFVASACAAGVVCFLIYSSYSAHLIAKASHQRLDALIWPTCLVVSLVALCFLIGFGKKTNSASFRRAISSVVLAGLFLGQASFLFFAGVGIPTYSHAFFPATSAELRLEALVGTKLLGLDGGNESNVRSFAHIGFYPNVNIGYGIRLFAIHDPLIPSAYYTSWPIEAARGTRGVGLFVPDVNSAVLARGYGISYLIATPPTPPPPGTKRLATLGGEVLYSVPGASQFSFLGKDTGRVLSVVDHGNGSYSLDVDATRPATLVLRLTALPGWNVTSDGASLHLSTYDGVMESVVVDKGRHSIEVRYFPARLWSGIDAAILGTALLVFLPVFHRARRRSAHRGARR